MTARPPILDSRKLEDVLAQLDARAPGYVPELAPRDGGKGAALLRIFSRYVEVLVEGENRLPEREFAAFLDMLGTQLLPAQSARVPLVFSLLPTSPVDVTLGARSQVAARLQPPPPSLLDSGDRSSPPDPPLYFTEHTVTLTRAKLAALHSVDPGDDSFADHSGALAAPFTLFDRMQPMEHLLYLGHDTVFALAGAAEIVLTLDFAASPTGVRSLLLEWEYLSQDGWLPLTVADDTTARFTQDGLIRLQKDCGPDAKEDTVAGIKSYWIRGRVSARPPSGRIGDSPVPTPTTFRVDTPWQFLPDDSVTTDGQAAATILSIGAGVLTLDRSLPGVSEGVRVFLASSLPPLRPQGVDEAGAVPSVDVIRARVGFTKSGLKPEKALTDSAVVDTGNTFYPFGQQPAAFTTFFIGSKEVFQRVGARVRLEFELAKAGTGSSSLVLAWEYNDGTDWKPFDPLLQFIDETKQLTDGVLTAKGTRKGAISFLCPADWREFELNGVKNYWMRARIDAGDYGQPLSVTIDTTKTPNQVVPVASTLAPPVVAKLALSFTYFTNPSLLDHCLAYNDFAFEEHSEDARWPRRPFTPLRSIEDRQPAVHFAFDQKPPSGLVSLFFAVPTESEDTSAVASPFVWDYRTAEGWVELGVLDETLGFRKSGMIQFVGPPDAAPVEGLGGNLYRFRARLKPGERIAALPSGGVWLNAAWGVQGTTIQQDILGTSDGNPGQTLRFPPNRVPVLEGETIEVQEWTGRGNDWQTAVQGADSADVRLVRDPVTNDALEAWVHWRERTALYDSGPSDRVYVIERATGALRFGDGTRGLIPPAGARVSASYATGGGLAGNVPAGAISELRTGVPYLQGVTNPLPATGGVETETTATVLQRGPQRIRNRGRAIALSDYEWLAREASPGVARARALQVTGPDGQVQRGWASVILIPYSADPQPHPTAGLLARVQDELSSRVPAAVARHVRVMGPRYTPVDVVAEIVPRDPTQAALVEAGIREKLNGFLHPLTGGTGGAGWDFGQPVYLSQIAALLEGYLGVDYVSSLGLRTLAALREDWIAPDPDSLVAPGDHALKLLVTADKP